MTTIATGPPASRSALSCRRLNRPSSAARSPPRVECFDIFSLPGDSDVTSHVAWLNSSDAYNVASSRRQWDSFWVVVWLMGRIGCLLAMPLTTTASYPTRVCRRHPMESLSCVIFQGRGPELWNHQTRNYRP